jgi:hypothetical protein
LERIARAEDWAGTGVANPKSRSGKLGFRLNDLAVSGVGA